MGHRGVPQPPDFVEPMVSRYRDYFRDTDPNYKESEPVWKPQWYFLFGPLADPAALASVLGVPEPPRVFRANTLNSDVKLWGDLPALFWNGRTQYRIHGVAYKTQSEEESEKLDRYLTMDGMYKKQLFGISWEERLGMLPPIEKYAVIFFWDGDMSPLREGELPPGLVDEQT